jgi:hypothetical protein
MRKTALFIFLVIACPLNCPAKELVGKKAEEYIGDLSDRIAKSSYSVILLERRNRDNLTNAKLDGIVLMPLNAKFRYIRQLDEDHRLKLNVASGRQAVALDPSNIAEYGRLIKENKLNPHVILDKQAKEVMIVYCSLNNYVSWSKDRNGEILLEVRDIFKKQDLDFTFNRLMLQEKK